MFTSASGEDLVAYRDDSDFSVTDPLKASPKGAHEGALKGSPKEVD